MRRGALDWLREVRERAEAREARALRASRAGLEEARRLRDASEAEVPPCPADAADLVLAEARRAWSGAEMARWMRRLAEARARALASRAEAEGLRRLQARRSEARWREVERRREATADDGRLLAWARRGGGPRFG